VIVGFTGSSKPIPLKQRHGLHKLVAGINWVSPIMEAHHGDCVEADAEFDQWCAKLGIERHAHPGCDQHGHRPHAANCAAEVVHPVRPYIERNRVIVDAADVLIACPSGPEQRRSGTWSTIRYARHREVPVAIIWPDGRVEQERNNQ
jgi:hypothetical protein